MQSERLLVGLSTIHVETEKERETYEMNCTEATECEWLVLS